MKLRILSDLHIEYGEPRHLNAIKQGDEDVVVCAGDVANGAQKGLFWLRERFPDKRIVFVPGNHEYYGEYIESANEQMLKIGKAGEIDVLINGAVKIDGRYFYGTTLWSNFGLPSPFAAESMMMSEKYVNDFRMIKVNDTERLSARYVLRNLFADAYSFLEANLQADTDEPPIVVTHFAPCTKSTADRFRGDPVTPYFVNNLDHMIPGAKLWIHGHCHTAFDYEAGDSRVICNPSGYRGERARFEPDLIVEV